jgi:hypothetical protein
MGRWRLIMMQEPMRAGAMYRLAIERYLQSLCDVLALSISFISLSLYRDAMSAYRPCSFVADNFSQSRHTRHDVAHVDFLQGWPMIMGDVRVDVNEGL